MNYLIKYRTFDSLVEDIKLDLKNISSDSVIDPGVLIKVARRVNYDLGLKIHKTKEVVLEIEKGRAKLPDDFYLMNFALLCGSYRIITAAPQGTHIEDVSPEYTPWVDPLYCSDESNPQQPPCLIKEVPTCLDKCGNEYRLLQTYNQTVREYTMFAPIHFRKSDFIDCDNCPNIQMKTVDSAYIKDGWVYTNLDCGNLYINYEGDLISDDGDLLVLDHPMINEYYEYALKKRVLENLIMDNINVTTQYQLVTAEYRAARNNALTIVNTPDFSEMAKVWRKNRKMMYGKYYDMFSSFGGLSYKY